MACNCGKNRRLPKIVQPEPLPAGSASGSTHVFFYAIPPEGSDVEPSRFATLREARWYAQRQKSPGWAIEGRRERSVED